MNAETINAILKIDDSYKAPQRLMDLLMDADEKVDLFSRFISENNDFSYEWFQKYFEDEHADRKEKKQDFTPDSISKLLSALVDKGETYFESTAGTGGLLINYWNNHPDAYYHVEELSDRAIPFLMFNMSIRNMGGIIYHGDSLTKKWKAVYELERTNTFSAIIKKKGEFYA